MFNSLFRGQDVGTFTCSNKSLNRRSMFKRISSKSLTSRIHTRRFEFEFTKRYCWHKDFKNCMDNYKQISEIDRYPKILRIRWFRYVANNENHDLWFIFHFIRILFANVEAILARIALKNNLQTNCTLDKIYTSYDTFS